MIHGDFAEYSEDEAQVQFHLENKKLLKASLQYGPVMAAPAPWSPTRATPASRTSARAASRKDAQEGGDQRGDHGHAGDWQRSGLPRQPGHGHPGHVPRGRRRVLQRRGRCSRTARSDRGGHRAGRLRRRGAEGDRGGDGRGVLAAQPPGSGYVAVTSDGPPVVLDVAQAQTVADADAVVLWTQGVSMSPGSTPAA